MNLTRMALTVGLACVAANLVKKARRVEPSDADDGLEAFPSVDIALPTRMGALTGAGSAASAASTVGTGMPGTGSDSPNDAERLQANGVAAESDDGGRSGDLFTSTSQDGPYARAPGLPDFARGA